MAFLGIILRITEHSAKRLQKLVFVIPNIIYCFLNMYIYIYYILCKDSEIGGLVYLCNHDTEHKVTSNTFKTEIFNPFTNTGHTAILGPSTLSQQTV